MVCAGLTDGLAWGGTPPPPPLHLSASSWEEEKGVQTPDWEFGEEGRAGWGAPDLRERHCT